jgi:5'-nucleotidase
LKILLTNDDGINTPGIWILANHLSTFSEVIIIAPESNQSGVGTSISLQNPITVSHYSPKDLKLKSIKSFALSGTPADCVIFGTEKLSDPPFDLIISGPNKGFNTGFDIINSGTFGAAIQGFSRGLNSIAVSIGNLQPKNSQYYLASKITSSITKYFSDSLLEEKLLLNINLPDCESNEIKGVNLTNLGPKAFLETIEKLDVPKGEMYEVKHNNPINPEADPDTDVWSVKNHLISITPVNFLVSKNFNRQKLEQLVKTVSLKT